MCLVREHRKSPFLFTDDSSDLLDKKVEAAKNRGFTYLITGFIYLI